MLVVGLNRTGHRVAIPVRVHLMDVIKCGMGLVAIAWAQFDEHCLADGLICRAKYFALDFVADGKVRWLH